MTGKVGDVDLLDVLLRRGLGRRHPLPLHRRRADRGAEVLPRHPAGRRGPPRRLLPPLLQGGDRGRRRLDPATLASTLPQLNWGYRGVFDRLDRMAEELRKDRSLPKFAQAITLYHLIVEGTLAQPGQHFIEDFFAKEETMPGFSAGMVNVSRDEQRHIGFGVKVLSELLGEGAPAGGEPRRRGRAAARGPALRARGLLPAELGPRVHRVLRLHARGHLRLRPQTDPPALAHDRLPDRGDAARRLPLRPRGRERGDRRAPGAS